jgi:hypothetical protein
MKQPVNKTSKAQLAAATSVRATERGTCNFHQLNKYIGLICISCTVDI